MNKQVQEFQLLFLTPEEASKKSGIGVNTIRRLMEERKIAFLQIGNRRLTTVQALLDYFEREKVPAL